MFDLSSWDVKGHALAAVQDYGRPGTGRSAFLWRFPLRQVPFVRTSSGPDRV
jgi:hypothetical protein